MPNEKLLSVLNSLLDIPFEQWKSNGIHLISVSTNANGKVNSGLLRNGIYFFRKHEYTNGSFTGNSKFVLG